MFGRLRMSLREAKSAYTSLSSEIFDRKQHYRGLKGALPYMSPSWRTTGLEKSIKKIIADSVEPLASGDGRTEEQRLENIEEKYRELFTFMPSPSDLCRVLATYLLLGKTY